MRFRLRLFFLLFDLDARAAGIFLINLGGCFHRAQLANELANLCNRLEPASRGELGLRFFELRLDLLLVLASLLVAVRLW